MFQTKLEGKINEDLASLPKGDLNSAWKLAKQSSMEDSCSLSVSIASSHKANQKQLSSSQ